MRVLLEKSTGRIIEAQENDAGGLEVLISNAESAGFDADDVEAKIITLAAYNELMAEQIESDKDYATKRREAYPSVGDQLDDLYKSGLFSEEMAERIAAVKAQFSK